ncbi:MAG: hypothetical protein QOE94_4301, partial [Mycobacterium sp.]|nr:hypothetical protein [Mycobacterium sp.]
NGELRDTEILRRRPGVTPRSPVTPPTAQARAIVGRRRRADSRRRPRPGGREPTDAELSAAYRRPQPDRARAGAQRLRQPRSIISIIAGHRIRGEDIPGRSFYELSAPAGRCCSGAPVSIRRDMWRAIGVYVGERRNETGTFAVGFATRAEVIAQQWPQLVDETGDLPGLCQLPPGPPL